MNRPAQDLVETIKKKQTEKEEAAYKELREVVTEAITAMMKDGEESTEVVLRGDLIYGLRKVTDDLRNTGYKYCLIEREDKSGDWVLSRLRISVEHLMV